MPKTILLLALLAAGQRVGPPRPDGVLRPRGRGRRQQPAARRHRGRDHACASRSRRCSRSARRSRSGPRGYRVGLEGTLASGKFHSSESGSDTDLGTLRTATLHARPRGPGLARRSAGASGLGGITYWPADDEGIFRRRRHHAIPGRRRRRLPAARAAQVGPHDRRCATTSTASRPTSSSARGFSQTQGVSRVSLSVGLSRSAR